MKYLENEISKEEYERMSAMTYGELTEEIEKNLPDYIKWGYCYYGHRLEEKDGKYYLIYKIGSTCD